MNAVTFLFSAALVARNPGDGGSARRTRSHAATGATSRTGFRLVFTARPLRTVLVVWNVALIGSAAVNVAEVVFAKDTLDAGDVGFGALVAASGVGLAFGSFLSAPALGKVGLRRNVRQLARADGGRAGARRRSAARSGSPSPFVVGGAAGNGSVIVCNRLLVQRGAPDQYRGRALATIMSSNYAVLGLAMAAAGVLTDVFGARAVWIGAGVVYLVASVVALVLTRWLPVARTRRGGASRRARSRPSRRSGTATPVQIEPELERANGASARTGLERIATLLEEIEARREAEAKRQALAPHRVPAWRGRS